MALEQEVYAEIDLLQFVRGSMVQDCAQRNLLAGRRTTLHEVPPAFGRCDYLLLIDRIPAGITKVTKAGQHCSLLPTDPATTRQTVPRIWLRSHNCFINPPASRPSSKTGTILSRIPFGSPFYRPETLAQWSTVFPGRVLIPKVLTSLRMIPISGNFFSHYAPDVRPGQRFSKKITYKGWTPETKRYEKSEHLIQEFLTSPQLRIAVTVDMIAIGTGIKQLECLLCLCDVGSCVYFEQMKGCGICVLFPADLQAVSHADARATTHFVIVDTAAPMRATRPIHVHWRKRQTVALGKCN